MSEDDFDALVALIGHMVYYITSKQDHSRDRPRQEAIERRHEETMRELKERLVL